MEMNCMKKLKLYFDASAIGYLDAQDKPNDMSDMLALWEHIKQGKYDVVISQVTLDEINSIQNADKLSKLESYLTEVAYTIIEIDSEIERVADLLKTNKLLISDRHQNDRLHIGCAVVYSCDVLVSYNFKHLVNVRTIKGVRGISSLAGYGSVDIMTATMLMVEGDE
jgi:predicted nucleic acid-binding protein